MNNHLISPDRSDWDILRQPLEQGERKFIEYLDSNLPDGWEIYIQPAFNGLCPDVIIVHPKVGICIFEVKNWNFDATNYYLHTTQNGKLHLRATTVGGDAEYKPENPVDKLLLHRKEMMHLYTPQLGTELGGKILFCGLVFPSATKEQLANTIFPIFENRNRTLMNEEHPFAKYFVFCKEDFNDNIENTFPRKLQSTNSTMNDIIASYLRFWLIEPDASKEQRTPLELNKKQIEYATTRTKTGYRRLKGPAGSGKSLIVAKKAANLLQENKRVLVVSFNITLCNYLTDLAVREYPRSRKEGAWLNFHYLCSRICIDAGYENEYHQLFQNKRNEDEFIDDNELCSLVEFCIQTEFDKITTYDAILVDEGQDYNPRWWNILRKLLNKDVEMLLVADTTQDIYDTAGLWTDEAMKSCGFSGQWAELHETYRLPPTLFPLIYNYIEKFIPEKKIIKPEVPKNKNLDMFADDKNNAGNFKFRWINEDNFSFLTIKNHLNKFEEITRDLNMAFSDQTILSITHNFGLEICKALKSMNRKYIDIFSNDWKESRRKKQYFFKGSQSIKTCTIHSYKGWESRALMIFIEDISDTPNFYELLYVALTRLKDGATSAIYIVCTTKNQDLAQFGKAWDKYYTEN